MVEYASGLLIKRVFRHGDIQWQGQRLFLSEALGGEDVSFEPLPENGMWLVCFGRLKLAKLDEKKRQVKELTAAEAQA